MPTYDEYRSAKAVVEDYEKRKAEVGRAITERYEAYRNSVRRAVEGGSYDAIIIESDEDGELDRRYQLPLRVLFVSSFRGCLSLEDRPAWEEIEKLVKKHYPYEEDEEEVGYEDRG